ICSEVAEISHVPLFRIGTGVRVVGWIEMWSSGGKVRCGQVTFFVDVKAMFSRGEVRNPRNHAHTVFSRNELNVANSLEALRGGENRDGRGAVRSGLLISLQIGGGEWDEHHQGELGDA